MGELITLSDVQLVELLSTSIMTGIIWIVQLVHYPLFSFVSSEQFSKFEFEHCRKISWIVIPTMFLEIGSACINAFVDRVSPHSIIGLGLLLIIWLSTFLIQVPLHNRLQNQFDLNAHSALVRSNWIRTFGWTARFVLLVCAAIRSKV